MASMPRCDNEVPFGGPVIEIDRAQVTELQIDDKGPKVFVDREAAIAALRKQGYVVARPVPENMARSA